MKINPKYIFGVFIVILLVVGFVQGTRIAVEANRAKQKKLAEDIAVATDEVERLANGLHALQENNRYVESSIDVKDPWGYTYGVIYANKATFGVQESLMVFSRGPDGKPDTEDDITTHRELPVAKGELRGAAERTAGWAWKKVVGDDDEENQ